LLSAIRRLEGRAPFHFGGTMQDLINRLNAAQETIAQLLERL